MGSPMKTITIFKQWPKLPPRNSGWSFQMYTCDLRRRKSHLKLMKQVYSIHTGSLSTARQRAGSKAGSHHVPPSPCSWATLLGSLPGVAHSQSILSSTQEATLTPHRPQEQRSGPALATGCPSAKPGSSQACACTYVYVQTTPMLGQLELKNRLRHMLNSWSRQILRLFLKTVPLLLWHSCLELSISGPIYKPLFNWQARDPC